MRALNLPRCFGRGGLTTAVLAALAASLSAQYAERPSLAGSLRPDVDVSGRSVKNKRVRAVHSDDDTQAGTTAWFIRRDPFLAYQLGRNLNFREFRSRDGVFDTFEPGEDPLRDGVSSLGGPMPDGTTNKITALNQTSCLGCHNQPNGNPGGGANFHKDSGRGRNSPHYFGAGVTEMLALQVRAELMRQLDTDQSGWISAAEAQNAPTSMLVAPHPGAAPIDYGDARLDGAGRPQLNNIFKVWFVDDQGRHLPGATGVGDRGAAGYNFNMIVWGWGQGPGRAALNPTNRAFLWDPFNAHGGLEAHDPSTTDDPDGDGVSQPTLNGAEQFPATHRAPDGGLNSDRRGFSRDDPDGDGYLTEISEGDLDLGEFFMLNAPRPAFAGTPAQYAQGLQLMNQMNCTSCHVANWRINAQDETFAGDRRLFDLDVRWNPVATELQGRLRRLYTVAQGRYLPNRGPARIEGIFTDFKHHDMGAGFEEIGLDGTLNRLWRTAPLWGVGSGFPWGHDGASLTLEDAILRHDGAGAASKQAYLAADDNDKALLVQFLSRLQLYDIESLPADIDDDGLIDSNFVVAGMGTGIERFNAEWLFRIPVRIQGDYVNVDGITVTSFAATNLDQAYGQDLRWRADSDNDGWPDVWDDANGTVGYRDGVLP